MIIDNKKQTKGIEENMENKKQKMLEDLKNMI